MFCIELAHEISFLLLPVPTLLVVGGFIVISSIFMECLINKGRLVSQGFSQQPDLDFDGTFNVVVKPATILPS